MDKFNFKKCNGCPFMITLKNFLNIANDDVVICEGNDNVILINESYFDNNILSADLLNKTVVTVNAENGKLLVTLEEGI